MKLKYERFEGLGCFSIRGNLSSAQLKIVVIGLESMVHDLEETLLVNLSNAAITDPLIAPALLALKKKLATQSKQKIYWICKEKTVGDFPTTDLFISRLTGFKFRQIGDRIKLDDQLYALSEEVKYCDTKIAELGGDEQNAQKVIIENKVLRAQKRILEEATLWQDHRMKNQAHIASTDPDVTTKTAEALKALKEPIKTNFGVEIEI